MIKSTTARVDIDKIKIPSNFATTLPSAKKITERYRCYQKTGIFDREILVDENYNLIDGYSTYLVCKMLGLNNVRVLRLQVKLTVLECLEMAKAGLDRMVEDG